MIMACALVRIIKTIPQERDGTRERHRVTDNTWCEWVEICCHGYHYFLCCV